MTTQECYLDVKNDASSTSYSPENNKTKYVPERIGDKDNCVHVFKLTDLQYVVGFGGEEDGIIVNRSNVMKW